MPEIKKIAPLIPEQQPTFVKTDHPKFVDFLQAYYEFLEDENNAYWASKRLTEFRDIDFSPETLYRWFKKEFTPNIPEGLVTKKSTIIKNAREFYLARGTEKSFELFFRMVFNAPASFYYPARDMLRASDGKWVEDRTIRVSAFIGDPRDFINTRITGSTSGAIAVVDKVLKLQVGIYSIYELYLQKQSIEGNFSIGETITSELGTEAKVYPLISSVQITAGGEDYEVGDIITITDSSGAGAKIHVRSVNADGKVTAVDILDPGVNYSESTTITFPTESEQATGTVTIGTISRYPGYFLNEDGHLSTTKFIQDSFFYQVFSYEIKVNQSVNTYRELVKKLLHPAGYVMFGEVAIINHEESTAIDIASGNGSADTTITVISDTEACTMVLDDTETTLILDSAKEDGTYGLGPSLGTIERMKFDYLPSSVHPDENDLFFPPNEDYWTEYANAQVEHFGAIVLEDMRDRPWIRTHFCPDPTLRTYGVDQLLEDFALIGVTGDLNPDLLANVTSDSEKRVSALADDRSILDDFTAATTERPWISRSDNMENLFFASEDLTDASWTVAGGTITANDHANPVDGTVDADRIGEDLTIAERSVKYVNQVRYVPGRQYVLSGFARADGRNFLTVKFNEGNARYTYIRVNLSSGSLYYGGDIDAASVETEDDWSDWVRFQMTFTATEAVLGSVEFYMHETSNALSYGGDGTGGIHLWGVQIRDAEADPEYLKSDDAINYRGTNGREVLVFEGAQEMACTSDLDDMIDNNAETVFVVFSSNDVEQTKGTILRDSSDKWSLYVAGGDLIIKANDGSDETRIQAIENGEWYIVKIRHESGSLYFSLNGTNVEQTIALGNISSLTGTLILGGGGNADYFIGKIARVITDDDVQTVAEQNTIYNLLSIEYAILD